MSSRHLLELPVLREKKMNTFRASGKFWRSFLDKNESNF